MARYPSGITPVPGGDVVEVRARLARLLPALEEHPLGATAPCRNPECAGPVDYLGRGIAPSYCSSGCRARTATLRRVAAEQLEVITAALADAANLPGVPRAQLRERANQLRWWLDRLG